MFCNLARTALSGLACAAGGAAQTLLSPEPVDLLPLPTFQRHLAAAAAGDLDNDGDDDLAVCENGEAAIYWQMGAQRVRTLVLADVNAAPTMVAAADFDGDGFLDLVFGPYGSSTQPRLRFFWGNGTIGFGIAPTTDHQIPDDFRRGRLAVADFDQDGDADIVLTKPPGALLHSSIYLQSLGNRTFGGVPTSVYPLFDSGDCHPFAVDVDGDSREDIVVVSRTGRSFLFWNDNNVFTPALPPQFPVVQQSLRGLAVGDFDGDGLRDLVFGGDVDGGVFLRCTGPRQFAIATGSPPPPSRCVALVAGDVDGDGKDDIHAFRREQGQVLRSDGTGAFVPVGAFGSCENTIFVAPIDLDGDGDRDLLRVGERWSSSGPQPERTIAVSYAVREGRYEHVGTSRIPPSVVSATVAVGNIDGDGMLDLLLQVADGQGTLTPSFEAAINDGRGAFAFEHVQRVGVLNGRFLDLDGDGRDEFVRTGPGGQTGYLANVQGVLAATLTPLPLSGTMGAVATIDVEGDGDADLLFLEQYGQLARLRLLLQAAGTWQEGTATHVRAPAVPYNGGLRFVVADLDGDGDDDVLAASDRFLGLLRNDGGVLTFVPDTFGGSVYLAAHTSAADLDGDGDLDVTSGRGLWLNDGTARFTDVSSRIPAALSGTEFLGRTADVDDDGDLDLVGSNVLLWNDGNASFTVAQNVSPLGWGGAAHAWTDVDRDGDVDLVGGSSSAPVAIYVNKLRQLWFASAAPLGGTLDFRYHVEPGQTPLPMLVWFGCSLARTAPTWLDGFGWLQVDATQLIPVGPFVLPPQGADFVHPLPLPSDPALRGTYFCAQPVELRGTRFRIGNFVETLLGR